MCTIIASLSFMLYTDTMRPPLPDYKVTHKQSHAVIAKCTVTVSLHHTATEVEGDPN